MPVLTASRIVLLIGVLIILLAAFGIEAPAVNLFQLGVGVCFAAGLVP
jgi:hypothetical protein